ncbi:MAG: type II toxin-antitoxin system RelE/ParE family toxin [Saprospiraceae bacterium]
MNFDILNKKLLKRLNDPAETVKAYGKPVARRIHQRLQEFEAAESLEIIRMLPAANCHELTGKDAGFLAVDVSANYRMIIAPKKTPPPEKEDGGLDWSAVTEIVIHDIIDYH